MGAVALGLAERVPKMNGEVRALEEAEEGAVPEREGDEVAERVAAEEEEECCSDMAAAWRLLIPSWRVNLLS